MSALHGKKVGVFGLGKSGLAAIALALRDGARVVAIDEKPDHPEGANLRARGVELALGPGSADATAGLDVLVVSPGVPLAAPAIARARGSGVEIFGEIELAFRHLAPAPFVGITGTNGKSTTTALTGEIFRQAGRAPFVGGNLGRPLAEAPLSAERFGAYVVELSSFQLEGIVRTRVNAAAILNLTPDHIDRYPSHAHYGAAKARIFFNQEPGDVAVVNADDVHVLELAYSAKVPIYGFTMTGRPASSAVKFAGLAIAEGDGFRFDFAAARFRVINRALRGAHNLQNAMASALLASLCGVADESIDRGLATFPGLPHRIESVRMLDGVEWVNDSKATNVDSSLVALRAFERGVWLIAGGKGKGAPYAPMVEASRGKVSGVLTIGQDAPAIAKAYDGVVPVHACETLANAITRARSLAKSGDVVLLSPACASYDQFKNFEDRGDTFKLLVRGLE
jgi:UDP-N-acetylmuramoylalanine--D-glutamate ligase